MKQHQWTNTVLIAGRRVGVFDTFSGGQPARENSKRRHAGKALKKVYPGTVDYGDVTVTGVVELDVSYETFRKLIVSPDPQQMSVIRQPLNTQLRPQGKPIVYNGWLAAPDITDTDSDSDDLTMQSLMMTVETVA